MDTVTDRIYKATGLMTAGILGFGFALLSADQETRARIWVAGIALSIVVGVPIVRLFLAGHKACKQLQGEFEADHREQLGEEANVRLVGIFPQPSSQTGGMDS